MSYFTDNIKMNDHDTTNVDKSQYHKILHEPKVISLKDITMKDLEFNIIEMFEGKPTYNCSLDFPNTRAISISYGYCTLYGAKDVPNHGYEIWVDDDIHGPNVVSAKEVLDIIIKVAKEPASF